MKGHKAYSTYRNHTYIQRQFKTGVSQGGILSPTLFNINTAVDLPHPRAQVQVMSYADGITIVSTHTITSAAKKYSKPYVHKRFLSGQNIIISHQIQPKQLAFCSHHTLRNLDLNINNTSLSMTTYPKVVGMTHNSHTAHIITTSQYKRQYQNTAHTSTAL